jgi:two-component system, OmpR family, response regulator
MELLIIEDDPVIGKMLRQGLHAGGHECTWAKDGIKGEELAASRRFDVVVLDLMLPDKRGVDVLKDLRAAGIRTPIILLTALGSVDERVAGLSAGADDYLVKPFAFTELMARIEALRRRSVPQATPKIEVGNVSLDLATRRVTRDGTEIELTPTEFSLLDFLMRHAGQLVTRKMLCEHLWESDWEGETNVIEVHINRLRGKLDKGFDESLIQTVRGRGYALRAPG